MKPIEPRPARFSPQYMNDGRKPITNLKELDIPQSTIGYCYANESEHRYVCTREPKHEGSHVAHSYHKVICVWEDAKRSNKNGKRGRKA